MKRLFIAIVITIIIVIGCVFEIVMVNGITNDMKSRIETVEKFMANEDLDNAVSSISQINEIWDKNYMFFAIFTSHERLEDIEKSLKSLETGLRNNEKDQFFSENEKIKVDIKYLKETELVKLQNIL